MEKQKYVISDDDDNARDEFSAAHHFKNQIKSEIKLKSNFCQNNTKCLREITNCNDNKQIPTSRKQGIVNLQRVEDNCFYKTQEYSNFVETNEKTKSIKRRKEETGFDFVQDKLQPTLTDAESNVDSSFIHTKRQRTLEISDESNNQEEIFVNISGGNVSNISQALVTPSKGYNGEYENHIVVPESSKKSKLVKVDKNSSLWLTIMDSCKIDKRVILQSPRKWCSPQEQFIITENNQYKSQCLISLYFVLNHLNGPVVTNYRFPSKNIYLNSLMMENINTFHFHELFLEKLSCNKLFDFMPSSFELTGCILGGFVNNLFELSNCCFIPNEIIHMAVDFIYQYLSRVDNVPLIDLKWITLGAIWVAAKYEGFSITDRMAEITGCQLKHLKQAELRLLMVIDFNLTKPHAINFRNRFLFIEQPNSTILHLSSFILDMTLHCYTLMLLPASKRAAAAMWLARLIDEFENIRFDDSVWVNMKQAAEKMDTVWPNHFEKLTGYKHRDISLIGLKMHVIILAFISGGEPKYPSVSACHDKYSSTKYGKLTMSYEKFTTHTVFYASQLYCKLNNLTFSSWMEENEFETLLQNFLENKVKLRRSISTCSPETPILFSCDSCPELTLKPIIYRKNDNKNKKSSVIDSGTTIDFGIACSASTITSTSIIDCEVQKLDSGCFSSSNLENL